MAAGLPLATALFGLGISSAVVGLLAAVMKVPDWAPALASMLGIGVGIDYALLIVTRYRAALAAGREPRAAVAEAVATGGRSVLIAGTTVVISLLGLFLMGLPYLYGAALSAIVGGARRHGRVDHARARAARAGRAAASTGCTSPAPTACRPIPPRPRPRAGRAPCSGARGSAAVAGVAILLVLAAPVTGLRLGFPDRGNDAPDTTTRQAYDLVAQGFGSGANGPLLLVADTARGGGDRVQALAAELRGVPGVAAVAEPVVEPARRRGGAERDAAHLAAGPGHRGPDLAPARRRAPARGRARERRRRDGRVHGPEPDHGRPAAAVHRRRGRARRSCSCSWPSARSSWPSRPA